MAEHSSATVLFASGARIDFDCESLETTRNVLGHTTAVEWQSGEGARHRLVCLNLDNVDAIVFHDATVEDRSA